MREFDTKYLEHARSDLVAKGARDQLAKSSVDDVKPLKTVEMIKTSLYDIC